MFVIATLYVMLTIIMLTDHFEMQVDCMMLHDSKVHGANMGPIWGRQDPGGPHVGPMNFVIFGVI